ncbi:unnamed protein product [Didymodactylos carnosus]|uniref:Protein kinase domain-containing protein n=1 Tax=Didymodactylos carnosus TaxID=1234261 RepID=A0A814CIQ2_9BILA|nr:unnamed protein product [Didymodactylos carnosus]CAF3717808.1 unnamed protein product [Didymodactylos carnosus]
MAKGPHYKHNHQLLSTRSIQHVRLYDDATLWNKYELMDKLGEGSFGTVFRVKNKESNLFYAMKTIVKKPGNKSKVTSLDNEVNLSKEVNHPNLIRLEEVLESSQNLYLIIELCEGGELGAFVRENGALSEETVKKIMSKLVNALNYLHKMDIVHRDLKLENILLKKPVATKTDEFDIKITDFGLSSKKSIIGTDTLFNEYCGTPLYMAPEILENKNYSALCDVWALGVIIISGQYPYQANDEQRLLEFIKYYKPKFDGPFHHLSAEGLEFLKGMLVYDTVHRKTMGELTVHPWLTGRPDTRPNKDIITLMREFQEENERTQHITTDNHGSSNQRSSLASANRSIGITHSLSLPDNDPLLHQAPNTTSSGMPSSTIVSIVSSNIKNIGIASQPQQIIDGAKTYVRTSKINENLKSTNRRTNPSSDTGNILSQYSKPRLTSMTMESSTDYHHSRYIAAPVTKLRTGLNRFHSQVDLFSSKQRGTSIDLSTHSILTHIPQSSSQNSVKHFHSSTLGHYNTNNDSSLSPLSNNHHHQRNNNTISKINSHTVPSYEYQRNEKKINGPLDKRNNHKENSN